MRKREVGAKSIIGAVCGVGSYLLNSINEILVILAIAMIIDYLLGVVHAVLNGKWNKDKGVRGLVKKTGYVICVGMGFLIDYAITWASANIGVNFNTKGFFGLAVTFYLFGTEGMSIASHLIALGVPVPPFLEKAFDRIRDTSQTMTVENTQQKNN